MIRNTSDYSYDKKDILIIFRDRLFALTLREHTWFAILCFTAVIVVFFSHELAHLVMGRMLDYDMNFSLNHAAPARATYRTKGDFQLISLSGPVLTLLLMVLFSWITARTANYRWFPFVFSCFYLTVLSGIMNIFNTNDLGRVSRYIGVGVYLLPALAILIQFILMHQAVKKSGIGQKIILVAVFWCLLFSSVIILLDQNFRFGFI